ncbi:hypothetical protein B5X24_HaOG214225 [Helicoverpa armigera]|nr:hypothetical protein B5X24_HaOG214225 [Helicoverpa armigera]
MGSSIGCPYLTFSHNSGRRLPSSSSYLPPICVSENCSELLTVKDLLLPFARVVEDPVKTLAEQFLITISSSGLVPSLKM